MRLAKGNPQFTAEHVLKVLLDDEQGMAASLIERAGGDAKAARLANDAALAKLPKISGRQWPVYRSPSRLPRYFQRCRGRRQEGRR